MSPVNVVIYGVGEIGGAIAKFLLEKPGVSITGAVNIDKSKVGKDLGEILNIGYKTGIKISSNIDAVLSDAKADIAIHATTSYLRDVYPQICELVKWNLNVISTCEELSYPYISEPELASKLDKLAKKHSVAILGTGINPGFIMDTLVIALTSVCQKIDKINVVRVVDASKRRLYFQRKIGVGLTLKEFERAVTSQNITGHIGLKQSIAMIASALSWNLQEVQVKPIEPVISATPIEFGDYQILRGQVLGIKQQAIGVINGKESIRLEFQAYLGAEEYDAITIHGVPELRQKIQPCIHGDIGTVAIITNFIPKILSAPAGLLTMKDLPLPSAFFGETFRQFKSLKRKR
ncbi:MAG: hypothetical protein QW782_08215 [Candidatus Bathyarchaeia archaeon]